MTRIHCLHCDKRILSLGGLIEPDRCPRCGKPLAVTNPVEMERAVRERLYGSGADLPGPRRADDPPLLSRGSVILRRAAGRYRLGPES